MSDTLRARLQAVLNAHRKSGDEELRHAMLAALGVMDLPSRARAAHEEIERKGRRQVDVAAEWGMERSSISLIRRLGICLVEMGVSEDSREWLLLAGKSGANQWPVGKVIDARDTDRLRWALEVAFEHPWDSSQTRLRPAAERRAVTAYAGGER